MGRVIGQGPSGTFIEWDPSDPEVKGCDRNVWAIRIIANWYEKSTGLNQHFPDDGQRFDQSFYYACAYLYYDQLGIESNMYVPETPCHEY